MQRRTWDVAEYEQRAKEREKAERSGQKFRTAEQRAADEAAARKPKPVLDGLSRPDIDAYRVEELVGTRRIVNAEDALSEQGGFYCKYCDYLLKDHKAYLEHCNKPRHLKAMGMPMHMKRAGADEVRNRLALHKQIDKANAAGKPKASLLAKETRRAAASSSSTVADEQPAPSKKAKADAAEAAPLEFDPAMFGLPSGFGGSSKSK